MVLTFIAIILLGLGLFLAPVLKEHLKKDEPVYPNQEVFNQDVKIVADFDKIVGAPIPFRVLGQTHFLKPINMKEFVLSADAMASVMDRLNNPQAMKDVTIKDLLFMYHKVISSVCDTITMKHIEKMSQAQARAVFQLVYDHITGRITDDAQKKN